ncbi:hypothetical protein MUCCIDRAFT_107235 [Mucor lusitanicus CBS 277.49]|uniref:Uncharacterized protein n=1 Tax=Mucor lusitanicus CBS 277.49 TaxID=747725 RepID=A0A168NS28_MUCCL|nr:hypothetical protein MUCCIDRAFT_107235 [Mucor lusitanicus CBS 277.49]
MPGGLERQNAFSEYCGSKTFTEYESDGDWIKIQCKCHTMPASPEYAYTHRHCLTMSGSKCKQCGQAYTQQSTTTPQPDATSAAATTTLKQQLDYKHSVPGHN